MLHSQLVGRGHSRRQLPRAQPPVLREAGCTTVVRSCHYGTRYIVSLLIAVATIGLDLRAQQSVGLACTPGNAEYLFVENKGQIGDQYGLPNADVLFVVTRPGLNIQLRKNGFSYDSYTSFRFYGCDEEHAGPERIQDDLLVEYHRVDIELLHANPAPGVRAFERSKDHLNYHSHVTEQTCADSVVSNVYGFSRILYTEVWPNIDLEWFLDGQGNPEYQFIVKPGGDVAAIRLHYKGAESTELRADSLIAHVAHGEIAEVIPTSYIAESKCAVDVKYVQIAADTYGYRIDAQTPDLAVGNTLVIDPIPTRSWGTYYGGALLDWSYEVEVMSTADVIISGCSESVGSIATAGAHQAVLSGVRDAILVKFDSSGTRQWGTYIGGAGVDIGEGIALTNDGDILLVGVTSSAAGIATAGGHQVGLGGGEDAFLMRFNGAGVRQWGTYYGGGANDGAYNASFTTNGEVVIVGQTQSLNQISTPGSHQAVKSGGTDAFVAKFNEIGQRVWATYYGGTNEDIGLDLSAAVSGSIVITGYTSSTTGIATAGGHQPSYGGGASDGFVARLNGNGVREWGSYYGGPSTDLTYLARINSADEILIEGRTSSTTAIATPGCHQATFAGGANDAFLVKFSSAGTRQWGTYFGGPASDYPEGTAILYNDAIMVCGSTNSTTSIATSGVYQTTFGGDNDAFLVLFDNEGVRQWGTYYGGNKIEFGGDVADALNGSVVMVGRTLSTNAIASSGAHQTVLGGDYDAMIVKFSGVSDVEGLAVTGTEHRVRWNVDTLTCFSDIHQVKLAAPHAKLHALPNESGTLALTSFAGLPVGSIALFATGAVPSGFLECNGQDVSRSSYSSLFDVLGTSYGTGNGTTTFGLPDLDHSVLRYGIRYE
jgi:uncharacterized protein (DUF2147 family)